MEELGAQASFCLSLRWGKTIPSKGRSKAPKSCPFLFKRGGTFFVQTNKVEELGSQTSYFIPLGVRKSQAKERYQNGREGGPGGIRASDPEAPSLNCLVVHANPNSKIQNPGSKIQTLSIQNPNFLAGFWGFDFGFWNLVRSAAVLPVRPPLARILDFGSGIWDFGTLCSNSFCADFGFRIFGFWDKFWTLHKIRTMRTPARVGGFGVEVPWANFFNWFGTT